MASLNQLLIDESFIALSATLKNQNIFDMLNVGERETIHSRFLGYLLDPNATHGLGTSFLESFLLCLSEFIDKQKIPDIAVSGLDLDMANSICEWTSEKTKRDGAQRIDVVLDIPYKSTGAGSLIIAIECKVNATQGKGQLPIYDGLLKKAYPDRDQNGLIHRILITRYEETPESNEWAGVLWQDLVSRALNVTFAKNGGAVSPKLYHLLTDYQTVINSWSDESDTQGTEDLCQKLGGYSKLIKEEGAAFYLRAKHREAYECMDEYFSLDTRQKTLLKPFQKVLQERGFYESESNNKHFRFWPSSAASHPLSPELSPYPSRWTKDRFPMLFEIEIDNSRGEDQLRAKLFLQFGPMRDQYQDDRYRLITALRGMFKDKESWKSGMKKSIGTKWARIADLKLGFQEIDANNAEELFGRYADSAADLIDQIKKIVSRHPTMSLDAIKQNP